ncbi:hypothetical protein H4R35_003376 [Dimargaris xerosporica]|nr:hypothetical protein H4R35_003376 [Dimargaris xerosporica]
MVSLKFSVVLLATLAATAVTAFPGSTKTNTHYETSTTMAATTTVSGQRNAEATGSSDDSGGGGGEEFQGDGTYYSPSVGLGSCGEQHSDSDMVVALNAPQYGESANPNNSPMCGKKVRIKGPKGEAEATIVDKCPPCKHGDVDMSPGVFDKIADQAEGRVPITWSFAG